MGVVRSGGARVRARRSGGESAPAHPVSSDRAPSRSPKERRPRAALESLSHYFTSQKRPRC